MEDYLNSDFYINQKEERVIYKYGVLITITFIIIFLVLIFFEYEIILKTTGIVLKEDKYYLEIQVPKEDVFKYLSNRFLYIDNNKLFYNVIEISEEYIFDNNFKPYKLLKVDIKLNEEQKIINNVIDIKKVYKKERLINNLLKKKGG